MQYVEDDSPSGNRFPTIQEGETEQEEFMVTGMSPSRTSMATEDTRNTTINSRRSVMSIHSALDRIGYGPFQHRILFAAGLCSAADAMEILMLSFLSVEVTAEWMLTPSQRSGLISCVFAGAFVGTLVLGRLGDVWGRRPTFLVTSGIVAVGGLCSALCQNYGQLIACRTVVGMGIGGVTIPFDTYGEILPTSRRGTGLAMPSYFWTTGSLLVVVGARVTTPYWRWLCVWSAVPCVMATIVAYQVVPESPRWLVSQGRSTRALYILREAAVRNGLDPDQVLPLDTILLTTTLDHEDAEEHHTKSGNGNMMEQGDTVVARSDAQSVPSVCDLFTRDRLRVSLSILAVWFGHALLYYGAVLAITSVFQDAGKFDYEAILVASLSEVVATTFIICTIDKWGRKRLLALSFGLAGLFIFGLCWMGSSSNVGNDDHDGRSGGARQWSILLAFFSRMCTFAGSAVTWIWTVEVLDTHLRTTGHSLANAGGRMGGFLSPFLVSPARFSYPTIGIILWIVSWTLVTVAWCNLPETLGAPMGGAGGGIHTRSTPTHEEEGCTSLELRPTSILHRKQPYQSIHSTTELT